MLLKQLKQEAMISLRQVTGSGSMWRREATTRTELTLSGLQKLTRVATRANKLHLHARVAKQLTGLRTCLAEHH